MAHPPIPDRRQRTDNQDQRGGAKTMAQSGHRLRGCEDRLRQEDPVGGRVRQHLRSGLFRRQRAADPADIRDLADDAGQQLAKGVEAAVGLNTRFVQIQRAINLDLNDVLAS